VRHVLSLLDLHGSPETPVACGRETPIEGTHEFPAAWRQAADSLYGVTLPASQRQPDPDPAPALIARILRESDAPITVLTLGPLTNTAEAFQQSPGSVANVERLVIMGGAVDAEGNVGSSGVGINNSVAEWNIYVDPTAAQMVLESGVPITLVPLDATNDVPATRAFYDCVEQSASTPEADFVHQLQQANREFIESGGYFFWDPATAATMTDGSLATFEERTITVDITEGPTSGQTRTDPSGTVIQMATGIDKEKFEALLLSVLNWP
jgi:pyrimidine-specific ribonucleoside hydrolase